MRSMNLASVFHVVAGSAWIIMIAVVAMALVRGTPASGQVSHKRCGYPADPGQRQFGRVFLQADQHAMISSASERNRFRGGALPCGPARTA